MKSFQTKTAVAILIAAGSIVPAFAQGHGGGDRGARAERPSHDQQRGQASQGQARQSGQAYQGQMRQQQARPQAPVQQAPQARGNFRGGGQQFQQSQQFRQAPQQQFRQQNNFREGNSFQRENNYRGFGGRTWENDHRNWSARGGYRGYVIPQNRFYMSFGREHYFRIGRPEFYDGYARFAYGGYSFSLLDPWPSSWGADWYDSDDVYVDYVNDGYYMYNRRYPGVGLALNIEF